jgi:hypothetical protein
MAAGAPGAPAPAGQAPEPTTLDPLEYSNQRLQQMLPTLYQQLFPNRPMGEFKSEAEMQKFYKYARGTQQGLAERKYKQLERYEKMLKDFTGASLSKYMKTGDPADLERLKKGTESNLQKIALEGVKEFNKLLTKPTKPDGSEYTAWEYGVEFASKLQRGLETTEVQRQPGEEVTPGTPETVIPESAEAQPAQTEASRVFEKNIDNEISRWASKLEGQFKRQGLKGKDLDSRIGQEILEKWGDPNIKDQRQRIKDAYMKMRRHFGEQYGQSLGRTT